MIVYKLTDQKMQTPGGYQWEHGVTRETDGSGDLCGSGWLHYYHDPLLAVLLNPIHADIEDPILWEAEAEGLHRDDKGLKGGCTKLTLYFFMKWLFFIRGIMPRRSSGPKVNGISDSPTW